jgi:hypothetical protein
MITQKQITTALSICLAISIIINFSNIYYQKQNQKIWESEYNDLWQRSCQLSNDYIDVINDLLIDLQYYDSNYEEIELLDSISCWG